MERQKDSRGGGGPRRLAIRAIRAPVAGLLGAAVITGHLAGCATYDGRYAYFPAVQDVGATRPDDPGGEQVRTLVTIVGVRLPREGQPASVEVWLRIDNRSPEPVWLEPGSLQMYTAALEPMDEPRLVPRRGVMVAAGDSGVVRAFFPFQREGVRSLVDLDGLSLRWTLLIGEQQVTSSASFTARPNEYYDYYHHRVGIGIGRMDVR